MKGGLDVNSTEISLLEKGVWPVDMLGFMEVFTGGEVEVSGYASWLVCILSFEDSNDDLSLMIREEVLEEAKLTEDEIEEAEEEKFKVWLSGYQNSGSHYTFDVVKIRKAGL